MERTWRGWSNSSGRTCAAIPSEKQKCGSISWPRQIARGAGFRTWLPRGLSPSKSSGRSSRDWRKAERWVEEELKALEAKRSHLEQLEQDKETVLEAYAAMAPEGLEELTSGGSAKDCTRSSDSRCSCPRTGRGSQLRHVCGNGRTGGQAFCEK